MNRDDITRMAKEAGFVGFDGDNGSLRRFAALVAEEVRGQTIESEKRGWLHAIDKLVAAEREACAKLCEEPGWNAANWCAKQIRARGEKK